MLREIVLPRLQRIEMRTDHGFYGKGLCSCAGAVPEIIIKTAAALIQTQRIYPRIYLCITNACEFARCGRRTKEHARQGKQVCSGGKWSCGVGGMPRVKQNRGNDWGVGRKAGGGASLYR